MSPTAPDQKPGSPPPAAPATKSPGPARAGVEPDTLTRISPPAADLATRFATAADLSRKHKREADELRTALRDSETVRAVCHRALDRSQQQPRLENALVAVGGLSEAEALRREMRQMDKGLRVMVLRDQAVLRGVGEYRRLRGEVGGLKRTNAALTAKKTRYLRKARKYKMQLLAMERAGEAVGGGVEQEDAQMDMGMDEKGMVDAEDDGLFVAQDADADKTGFVAQDDDDVIAPYAEKTPACGTETPAPKDDETKNTTTTAQLAAAQNELEAYETELAATKALLGKSQTELGETHTALTKQKDETELYKGNAETYREKLEDVKGVVAFM